MIEMKMMKVLMILMHLEAEGNAGARCILACTELVCVWQTACFDIMGVLRTILHIYFCA